MIIDAKKINVLEGDWLDKSYFDFVKPRLEQIGIPTFRQQVLPITQLHNDGFWANLRILHNIDLAILDPLLWLCDDRLFSEYLAKILTVHFSAISLGEYAFGHDMPTSVEPEDYVRKMFMRTELVHNAVKKRYATTKILSPAITVVQEPYRDLFLDYLVNNRHYFDVYAVHCCNASNEHTLGKLTSLLTQTMKALPKELWITKWAIPSFEGKLMGSSVMGPTQWEPLPQRAAQQRLRRSFSLIETIASAGSKWFYVGVGKDAYRPRLAPSSQHYWSPLTTVWKPDRYRSAWDFFHFLGFMTHDGQIKDTFFEAFLDLAKRNNE